MKKSRLTYSMAIAIVFVTTLFAGAVAWGGPQGKGNPQAESGEAAMLTEPDPADSAAKPSEEMQLVQALEKAGLISQMQGFVVEKKQDKLFINRTQVADNIAAPYLAAFRKEQMIIVVHSILERQKQHPGASIMQLLMPVSFSSPCVEAAPKKDGC